MNGGAKVEWKGIGSYVLISVNLRMTVVHSRMKPLTSKTCTILKLVRTLQLSSWDAENET